VRSSSIFQAACLTIVSQQQQQQQQHQAFRLQHVQASAPQASAQHQPTSVREMLSSVHTCMTAQPPLLHAAAATCRIYELYSDFVMKNPFYEVEQVRSWAQYMQGTGCMESNP
jgi:hypothetical protein